MTIETRPMADGDTLVVTKCARSGERVAFRLLAAVGMQQTRMDDGAHPTVVVMPNASFYVVESFDDLLALLAPPIDDSTPDNTPSPSPEDDAKAAAQRRLNLLYRSSR